MSNSSDNKFVVRVVLHGVDHEAEAYGLLHMEMRDRGFRRTITESETRYHLPPAEYFFHGPADGRRVFGLASAAVRAIGWEVGPEQAGAHRAAVLVTQSAGITFDGLAPAAADEDE